MKSKLMTALLAAMFASGTAYAAVQSSNCCGPDCEEECCEDMTSHNMRQTPPAAQR